MLYWYTVASSYAKHFLHFVAIKSKLERHYFLVGVVTIIACFTGFRGYKLETMRVKFEQ